MATHIAKRNREPYPRHKSNGSFSKPCSPVRETTDQAIQEAKNPHYNGDFLVKFVVTESGRCGWQVWMKRANARGARHPGDYDFQPTGRRAKKRSAGSARLFIQGLL